MIIKRRFRRFHYVVTQNDDIDKLISFTKIPFVHRYAYVKHVVNDKFHYHFYFVLKSPMTIDVFERIACLRSPLLFHDCLGSQDCFIEFLLRGDAFEFVDKGTFNTNIF